MTDHNLRNGIGEPNLCRLFQDLFAFITESIEEFKHAGGNNTFKNVAKNVQQTPEFLQCVVLSDRIFQQSLKMITASGRQCISALLSQSVKKCLTDAGVLNPDNQFVFSNHASCLRGGAVDGTKPECNAALFRRLFLWECKNLRVEAQVIRGQCTPEEAKHLVDTDINRNHTAVSDFCTMHGIVPARSSFCYCPYEVVAAVPGKNSRPLKSFLIGKHALQIPYSRIGKFWGHCLFV